MSELTRRARRAFVAAALGAIVLSVGTEAKADGHCETDKVEVTTPFKVITRSLLRPNEAAEQRVYWAYALDKLKGEQIKAIRLGDLDGVLFATKAVGRVIGNGVVLPSGGGIADDAIEKMKKVTALENKEEKIDVYLATTRNRLKDQEVDYDFIVQSLGKGRDKKPITVPCDWKAAYGKLVAERQLASKE